MASLAAIQAAERRLGFALPPLYAAMLAGVGNGGFGPFEGFAGVPPDGHPLLVHDGRIDLVTYYEEARASPGGHPARVLAVTMETSDVVLHVDCASPDGPVLGSDFFSAGPEVFWQVAPTLASWVEQWLEGVDLYEAMRPIVGTESRKNPFTGRVQDYPVRSWRGEIVDLSARG